MTDDEFQRNCKELDAAIGRLGIPVPRLTGERLELLYTLRLAVHIANGLEVADRLADWAAREVKSDLAMLERMKSAEHKS